MYDVCLCVVQVHNVRQGLVEKFQKQFPDAGLRFVIGMLSYLQRFSITPTLCLLKLSRVSLSRAGSVAVCCVDRGSNQH